MSSIAAAPTSATAAVLFLDLQEDIIGVARTVPAARLRASAGVLARVAALHELPAIFSRVPDRGGLIAEVQSALPQLDVRERTTTSAFGDVGTVDALRRASGRRVLALGGVASEVVVVRTALDALVAGYGVHVLVDACSGIDARSEDAAWRRLTQAGAVLSSVTTFIAELCPDISTELGQQTRALLREAIGG